MDSMAWLHLESSIEKNGKQNSAGGEALTMIRGIQHTTML